MRQKLFWLHLLAMSLVVSCSERPVQNVTTGWQVRQADPAGWTQSPSADQAGWRNYQVHDSVFDPFADEGENGAEASSNQPRRFWLRVRLPASRAAEPALFPHDVAELEAIYLNNQLIRDYRNTALGADHWPVVRLPDDAGTLLLLCRDPGDAPEGILGGVYFGEFQALQSRFILGDLDSLVLGTFFLIAAIFLACLVVFRSGATLLWSASYFMLVSALQCLAVSDLLQYVSGLGAAFLEIRQHVEIFFVSGILLLLDQLLDQKDARFRPIRYLWVASLLFGAFGVLGIFTGLSMGFARFPVYIGLMAVIAVYTVRQTIRGDLEARMFLVGFLGMVLMLLNDILKFTRIFPDTIYLMMWGIFFFAMTMAFILVRRFFLAQTRLAERATELQRLNIAYERFVPRDFMRELGKESILDVALGDQSEKMMTILFADIRDFTSISENMNPRENFAFINAYLGAVSPIIRRHGGFIDKYIGDAIMALFPAHPDAALECAREMLQVVSQLNRSGVLKESVRIGIGIHTGTLMLGTVGETERMEGTVISDSVNLAARLESLTRSLPADILISEATLSLLRQPGRFATQSFGEARVKGKDEVVRIFGLVGLPVEE
ncbi:MAG: hypothetical protein KDK35_10280 [Leptospiraceae bacterium]|nr:hypothetical protein [Leptospiraceae bacterium]